MVTNINGKFCIKTDILKAEKGLGLWYCDWF